MLTTLVVASCRHQGHPAFSATWSQGQAISHSAPAVIALAAYRIAAAARQVHSARATIWGTFRQRTIDRRYCGLPFIPGPASSWYPRAVRLAGGRPSSLVWQPFSQPATSQAASAVCQFCQSAICEVTSRCACYV